MLQEASRSCDHSGENNAGFVVLHFSGLKCYHDRHGLITSRIQLFFNMQVACAHNVNIGLHLEF